MVNVLAGWPLGERGLLAGAGDAAVQAERQLEGEVRCALLRNVEERRVVRHRPGMREGRPVNAHSSGAQGGRSARARTRIGGAEDYARHPGFDQGVCAGWGSPCVSARFEARVGGGSPRPRARFGKRVNLGVRTAQLPVPPFAHDLASAHQHTSHHRIGRDPSPAAAAEFGGPVEEARILPGNVCSSGPLAGARRLVRHRVSRRLREPKRLPARGSKGVVAGSARSSNPVAQPTSAAT